MPCICGNGGFIVRGKQTLCTWCFIAYFEKRVKRVLKESELHKGQKVAVVGELATYLFKKFVRVPVDVRFGMRWKGALEVVEWTEDDEAVDFFKMFGSTFTFHADTTLYRLFQTDGTMSVKNRGTSTCHATCLGLAVLDNSLKILRLVSDQDALSYAKLKGVAFLPRKKDKNWLGFVSQFDDYPEMKHTLARNANELRKLM